LLYFDGDLVGYTVTIKLWGEPISADDHDGQYIEEIVGWNDLI
jgi:hypothetical protein